MNARLNHLIRVPTVRLINEGKMVGVVNTSEAIRIAMDQELDLVEIDPNQKPPICKIMDYGKFQYEEAKKLKETRKLNKPLPVKEIQFSPNVDTNDVQIKTRKIREFLTEGHKVRLAMRFKGRDLQHKELGVGIFNSIISGLDDVSKVEQKGEFNGNTMTALIARK